MPLRIFLRTCFACLVLMLPQQQAFSSALDEQEESLARLSQDESLDLITRAEATRLLGQFSGPNALIAIGRASRSPNQEMRVAAIQAAGQWNGPARWDLVSPLLGDPEKEVSSAAVMTLIPHWSLMTEAYRDTLTPYVQSFLSTLSDDLEGQLIAAWAEQTMGNLSAAEIRLNSLYQQHTDVRIVLGYSKVLLANNKQQQAQKVLNDNLERFSSSAMLYHQLGSVLLMNGDRSASFNAYQMAYQLDPTVDHYALDYALSMQEEDPQASINIFEKLYVQSNSPQYLYAKCEVMLKQNIPAESCLADLAKVTSHSVSNALREQTPQ